MVDSSVELSVVPWVESMVEKKAEWTVAMKVQLLAENSVEKWVVKSVDKMDFLLVVEMAVQLVVW